MNMNREHTLELLTLLAVIAVVQLPGQDLSEARPDTETASTAASMPAEHPHRLDPVALLQASVPEHWRVELPPFEQPGRASMSC